MNSTLRKVFFSAFIIIFSIAIPIAIISLFFLIFPDFYSKGFLTGIAQLYIVCPVMMIANLIISTAYLGEYFKSQTAENRVSQNKHKYFLRIGISILVQIGLNILIENPFRDPPSWGF